MTAAYRAKYGPWALVAGASEGIGAAFATELARRGLDVVLVARRAEGLEALAKTLRGSFGVEARVAPMDLSSPTLLDELRAATTGLDIGMLVYNAAAAGIGPFLDHSLADKMRVIDVNCRGPVILADELGRAMAARGRGGIVVMTSIAGAQGSPFIATYAASKAFGLVLAEALWDELRDQGVDVLACRAGATRTPAYERSKPAVERTPVMDPTDVATQALDALGKGPSMVAGAFNAVASFFMGRVMSRRAAVVTMGRETRKMFR